LFAVDFAIGNTSGQCLAWENMAITCKICGKELDVFSGGRYRKCRRLVCDDYMAKGGATSPKGLFCKACVASETAAETPLALDASASAATGGQSPQSPAGIPAASRRKYRRGKIAALAALIWLALAGAIVVYPRVPIWHNLRVLLNGAD
jgi:hypothetical protein